MTAGMVLLHLDFTQMLRMTEESSVQTQARWAQLRGSSSSLKKILRTTSSENYENIMLCLSSCFCGAGGGDFFT